MTYERVTLGLRRKQELYDLANELDMKPSILCDVLISIAGWLMQKPLDELDGDTIGGILSYISIGGDSLIGGREVRLIDNALFIEGDGDSWRRILKP